MTVRAVQASFYQDPAARPAAELIAAWPTLTQIATAVARAGVHVSVVQAHARDERVTLGGVDIQFTPDVPAAIARLRPDVVHLQGLQFPVSTRRLCVQHRQLPVLVQDHGGGRPARWRQPLLRWGMGRIRGAVFTAIEQARAYQHVLPQHARLYQVLESSCAFQPGDQAEARAATGVFGDPAVLWVGRLNSGKDPHTALSAIKLAAEQLPDLQFWCCFGDGSLLGSIRPLIDADNTLRGRVHLLGAVPHSQIEQLCRACDLLLSTSRSEGSGYALIEALACGLTPIVSDIPSFRVITHRGQIGALARVGDAAAFAAALIRLGGQPRAAQRARASAHFQDHLTFDVIGRQLRHAYEEVLS